MQIKELFALDIERPIEEVIKVDQDDAQIVYDEISEYIVTDAILKHYLEILRKYWETKNKPHEGIGIWVSGFFGSGKSSFAKMLGLALQNREVLGRSAAELFGKRTGDNETQVLLKQITEYIPTEAGDLRCLDGPWYPQRQPEHHRDHVQAFPQEPRLRGGP